MVVGFFGRGIPRFLDGRNLALRTHMIRSRLGNIGHACCQGTGGIHQRTCALMKKRWCGLHYRTDAWSSSGLFRFEKTGDCCPIPLP